MVLKCETYPGAGYQQQTYVMVRESDGYPRNSHYSGVSGMPMGHTQSLSNYPQSNMPVFQPGHAEQQQQQHHSGWETGYGNGYNSAPSGTFTGGIPHSGGYANHGTFTGGIPHSGGYANHYPGNTHGHMGAGNMIEKVKKGFSSGGSGHSNYSHGSSAMHGHGGYQKSWTLKGLEDDE